MQRVLTPTEKRIAGLLLQGYGRADIAQMLNVGIGALNSRISAAYAKLAIVNDGIRSQSIRLVLLIHEQRAELGLRCKACDDP